ncbi:MAG: filamentous hemagglutinin N-terminal domain-containing protein, partial [Desulfobacteraceae bacterium]|nr:filamentous hemagglutinin N-terminal domain-containing protein [Desulfobacteraceae bacterium]
MKKNKLQFLVYILLWISNVIPVFAQISLDGTVGTLGQSNLTGPDYEIKSEYGKQAGNNLFHSFSQFNLNTNEVADFQVSSGIQNIVSRITGGSSSWIDGTLRCTIAGTYKLSIANLYLLNPSGVMLGPNANLDINGSFHISTANYLRLGENERFNAEPLKGEVLSVKAPSAFGFLDNDIAPITLEGKGELKWYEWDGEPTGLKVLNGKTISVIGGDIEVKKGTYYYNNRYNENVPLGIINAPEGRVNIVSVASAGEVIPMESDLDVSSCEEMGNIIVSEDSSISVSGEGAGNIYIRGGQFAIDNSFIEAETHGNKNGGVIDIQADRLLLKNGCISGNTSEIGRGGDINIFASDSVYLLNDNSDSYFAKIVTHANGENNDSGDGGNILIETNKLLLEDCAGIASLSKGGGNSGDITIRASEVTLINNDINLYKPIISTAAEGQITTSGGAGNIYIESKMLSLNKGTAINSSTIGIGKGGDITICAYDSVNLSGNAISDGEGSAIVANSYSKEDNTGDTGNILITTKNLLLNDGAQISSSSSSGIGNGGNITIRAFESVSLKGNDDYHGEQEERGSGQGSTILTIGYGGNANTGEGGNILIETKKLSLDNGAQINSSTLGGIDGGDITIYVSELISLSGKDVMSDEHPSTIFSRTESKETDASDAGNILIETERLLLNDGTWISSSSTGKGRGGDVAIIASESIYMSGENINGYGSVIDARADGEIENAGDAGSVLIKTKNLTITDKGEISTSTEGGGNANDVILEISQLHLDNGASISSASDLAEGKGGDAGRIIIGKVIETEQLFKLTDTSLEKLKTEGVSEATIIQLETLQGEDYKNQGDFTNTLKKTIGEDQAVQYESLILEHAEKANGEIIKLEPSDSILIQNGSITTKAKNAGGGKIYIHAKDKIHLQDSHINSDVEQGERKGGDITIGFKTDDQNDNGEGPKLTILDNSDITANADIGDGGAIFIYTDNYISSSDSNLSASSNRGNDGIIKISVPETDISDDLAVMPSNLIDATRWLTLCEERIGEKSSHFILSGRDGIPTSPDDYLTSPPIRLNLQRLKNLEELTQLLTNGEEFFNKGDFENAIQNWEQATPLLDTQKNIYVHTMVYLANAYQATGHHQKAKTALLDALPNINNHYGKTLIFSTLSDIFLSLKNMEQAEEYLEKSIEQ